MNITLLCPVHNPDTLFENLTKSPDILSGDVRLITDSRPMGAQIKIKDLLVKYRLTCEPRDGDFVGCVHEDVWIPEGFFDNFIRNASLCKLLNNRAALFGVAGAARVVAPGYRNTTKVYSCLMDKDHWTDNLRPDPNGYILVDTLDECFFGFFVDRGSTLFSDAFNDVKLYSGKHLYAAAESLRLARENFNSYVCRGGGWLEHRSKQDRIVLDPAFYMDCGILYSKYGEFVTTCVNVEKSRHDPNTVLVGSPELGPERHKTREEAEDARTIQHEAGRI